MAAARYWRLVGIESYARDDLELSLVHLYGVAGPQAGTLTSSHPPIAGSLEALSGELPQAVCRFAGREVRAAGFWVQWDFGAPVDIVGMRLGAGDAQDTFLSSADLQSSSDLRNWTAVSSTGRYPWPGARQMTEAPGGSAFDGDTAAQVVIGETVTDATGMFPVALVGSASIDTSTLLFGGNTVQVAGGQMAIGSPADFNFGMLPFTVEGWFKFQGTGRTGALFSRRIDAVVCPFELFIGGNGAIGAFLSGSWGTVFLAGKSLPLNQFAHVALVGDGATIRLFVDGQSAPNTAAQSLLGSSSPGPLYVGRGGDGYFSGRVGAVRVSPVCRYTAAFTPPESYSATTVPYLPKPLRSHNEGVSVAASSMVEAISVGAPSVLTLARDVEHGGNGTVYGTVEEKGTPANTPLRRRVVLIDERSRVPIRETWSDAVTGAYAFRGVATGMKYTALTYDHAGNHRVVAADGLVPEVLP